MSDTSNGTHKAPFADGPWEIVQAMGLAWIGKVIETVDGEVSLHPCFSYVFQAANTREGLQIVREVMPHEFFVSNVPLRLRWTHRRRLDDFDGPDRDMLRKLVDRAIERQKDLVASRSGLAIAGAIPKDLPRPG
jgi:hypothetical protein